MKKTLILFIIPLLFGCERYEQPKLLSLSGEYVIDQIIYEENDGYWTNGDSIYWPGTTYINRYEVFPMDTIRVGNTRWHFDYSVLSMCPNPQPNQVNFWQYKYFYDVIAHNSNYNLGYIRFYSMGYERIFKIMEDGLESLVLQSSPQWGFTQLPGDSKITMYLKRIGP